MLTDLTRVCVHCRLRVQAARRACPRCQRSQLLGVAQAHHAIRTGAPRSVPGGCGIVLATMALGGWLGWVAGVSDRGPAAISAFTFALIGLPVGLGLLALAETLSRRLLPGWWARLDVETVAPEDAPPASAVVGTIRGPLDAPLRSFFRDDTCVAIRIVGRFGRVAIDDADAVAFVVDADGGESVHVEPAFLVVAVDVPELGAVDAPGERLRAFLAARAAEPLDAGGQLAEATLRPGDRVSIAGDAVERADPRGTGGGLREAPVVRVFRGTLDRPVVVRSDHRPAAGPRRV